MGRISTRLDDLNKSNEPCREQKHVTILREIEGLEDVHASLVNALAELGCSPQPDSKSQIEPNRQPTLAEFLSKDTVSRLVELRKGFNSCVELMRSELL